jgi:hypothetical protein
LAASAGAKYQHNAFEHLAIVYRRAVPFSAAFGFWKQWFEQFLLLSIYEVFVFSRWASSNS